MKSVIVLVFMCFVARSASSYDVVYDPINHGTAVFNELTNIIQWVETEVHSAATELNTLSTAESEILAVARAGDPAQFKNLPGVSNIAELGAIYGQIKQDYQDIRAVADPTNFQSNFNSILSEYRQAGWNGFTAANGMRIGPNQGSFQFSTSSYQAMQTVEQRMEALDAQKKTLQAQRDAANNSLQSATTTAQVDKFHAVINSINGALADVNQSLQQLFNHAQIQQAQNVAAQKVYQAAQVEQQAAAAYRAIDSDMTELPSQGFRQLALWQN